jgi:hypothetical protein
MQVLDGVSLADLVQATGALPTAAVCTVAFGIAEALDAAHSADVLHRDVKPSNIGITPSGRVVLQDFGLARLAGEGSITRTGALVGTPQFMAPEAMRRALPGPAADWYGLGACMYVMITGGLPFGTTADYGAIMERALGTGVPPLTEADCPADLAGLVQQLCRQDPVQRLRSLDEVREILLPHTLGGTAQLAGLVTGRARDAAVRSLHAPPDVSRLEGPEYAWDEAPVLPEQREAAVDPFRPATLTDATRRIVLGSLTAESALSRQREAVNLVQRGRLQEAAEMLSVVVPVCHSALGPDHPTTLTSQYWQAVCLARLGAGSDALELFSGVNTRVARRTDGTDD